MSCYQYYYSDIVHNIHTMCMMENVNRIFVGVKYIYISVCVCVCAYVCVSYINICVPRLRICLGASPRKKSGAARFLRSTPASPGYTRCRPRLFQFFQSLYCSQFRFYSGCDRLRSRRHSLINYRFNSLISILTTKLKIIQQVFNTCNFFRVFLFRPNIYSNIFFFFFY